MPFVQQNRYKQFVSRSMENAICICSLTQEMRGNIWLCTIAVLPSTGKINVKHFTYVISVIKQHAIING